MNDRLEQFEKLPAPIQEQLIRIARLAAGMSADEKEQARLLIADIASQLVLKVSDDCVDAVEMISACGLIVTAADGLSGGSASGLVV